MTVEGRVSLPPQCHALPRQSAGARRAEHRLAVLLEGLPVQDLREEIGRVGIGRQVLDGHDAGPAHFAHLEELAIDVARMLRRGVAVTKVVSAFVVRAHLDHGTSSSPM